MRFQNLRTASALKLLRPPPAALNINVRPRSFASVSAAGHRGRCRKINRQQSKCLSSLSLLPSTKGNCSDLTSFLSQSARFGQLQASSILQHISAIPMRWLESNTIKPAYDDAISRIMFTKDVHSHLSSVLPVGISEDAVERRGKLIWRFLPEREKRGYKKLPTEEAKALLVSYNYALEKLEKLDDFCLSPHAAFRKDLMEKHELSGYPRIAEPSFHKQWLELDGKERLKYAWFAHRSVQDLKKEIVRMSYNSEFQALNTVFSSLANEQLKTAEKFKRPKWPDTISLFEPSEANDAQLRKFETELANWEAQMRRNGYHEAIEQLKNLEINQLILAEQQKLLKKKNLGTFYSAMRKISVALGVGTIALLIGLLFGFIFLPS